MFMEQFRNVHLISNFFCPKHPDYNEFMKYLLDNMPDDKKEVSIVDIETVSVEEVFTTTTVMPDDKEEVNT